MGVLVAIAVGLVFWVTAWAFGAKAFDAFLVTVFLTLAAAAAHIARPGLRRALRWERD
ncbi:hypothetical protein [Thermoleophilum album]|uniref:Uncharacterized protein n=1 Tax=Thermoleophilum album TaxID=29539 RepID=A0A1H6FT47_THEAL|nr:hypothetical protein [Thermoleophilum album]SEH14009.1 hypothetical protein SAMN02745716_1452 [Thermoleophilum album]